MQVRRPCAHHGLRLRRSGEIKIAVRAELRASSGTRLPRSPDCNALDALAVYVTPEWGSTFEPGAAVEQRALADLLNPFHDDHDHDTGDDRL